MKLFDTLLGLAVLTSPLWLLAIWLGLGWIGYRLWRRWAPAQTEKKRLRAAIGLLLAAAWILIPLWEVVGRKAYYDAQVNRLCAIDGGVKVYETVKLPAERFDEWGNMHIPLKDKAKPEDEYYIEWDIQYFKKGNPSLWRSHHSLIRRRDQKLIGESIMYARGGGDMPGPWQGSSFKCPEPTQFPSIESSVFLKGDAK